MLPQTCQLTLLKQSFLEVLFLQLVGLQTHDNLMFHDGSTVTRDDLETVLEVS